MTRTSPATRTEAPAVPDHDHAMVCQGCGASFLAILTDDEPATLDEAWRALTDEVPEIRGLRWTWHPRTESTFEYQASAVIWNRPLSPIGSGPTPAAALQALRDKLVAG